jgi:uncharacterized protein
MKTAMHADTPGRPDGGVLCWFKGAALAAAASLASCTSSPPERFYTLIGAHPAIASGSETPASSIAIGPVAIPELVDRPQLVVRAESQRVDILESHRWSQSLSREIAGAVADSLNRSIAGMRAYVDEGYPPQLAAAPALRVALRVDRFESRLDGDPHVEDVVYWLLRCEPAGADTGRATRSGLMQLQESAGRSLPNQGMHDALVAAHARALSQLSSVIAAAVNDIGPSCKR